VRSSGGKGTMASVEFTLARPLFRCHSNWFQLMRRSCGVHVEFTPRIARRSDSHPHGGAKVLMATSIFKRGSDFA
jgi:hypothetical protein